MDKIGAFIIEADPLPGGSPGGVERDFPFFHFPVTVGAFRGFSLAHSLLPMKLLLNFIQKEPNPSGPSLEDLALDLMKKDFMQPFAAPQSTSL